MYSNQTNLSKINKILLLIQDYSISEYHKQKKNLDNFNMIKLFNDNVDIIDLHNLDIKKYSRNLVEDYANNEIIVNNKIRENITNNSNNTNDKISDNNKNIKPNFPNSMVFNLIVSLTIKKIIEILDMDINSLEFGISNINNIHERYFNKIKLFLFYYAPVRRRLIALICKSDDPFRFGTLHIAKYPSRYIPHPIKMKRFDKYFPRLFYNFSRLYDFYDNVNYFKDIVYTTDNYIKINFYSDKMEDFSKDNLNLLNKYSNKKSYIKIVLDKKNFNYLIEKNNSVNIFKMFIDYYDKNENNNLNNNMTHIKNFLDNTTIGNNVVNQNYNFNLLTICLQKLDELNKNNNINDMKYYIILFYYNIILLMPFSLGTASIAEMVLYSLWKYYIRNDIKINDNIMLDVEALTNPFDIFYDNCLTNDSNETINNINYTPYLIELK
jgi:hypothetical protein